MRRKIYIIILIGSLLAITIALFNYKPKKEIDFSNEKMIFLVEANNIEHEIKYWCDTKENYYYVFVPNFAKIEEVKILFEDGNQCYIGERIYKNNEYLKDIKTDEEYIITIKDSNANIVIENKIKFMKAGDNIATMFIDTESGSMDNIYADKDYKEKASMYLINSNGRMEYTGNLDYIKGRGNWTWGQEKKPFNIRLNNSANLLNLGKAKEWILLANMGDRTEIRNKIIYDMANEIGLEYSPKSDFVNLYLNGEYVGLYQLSDKIEMNKNRINIEDNMTSITGPYLLEKDIEIRYRVEKNGFATTRKKYIVIKEPKEISDEKLEYISNLWQQMEDAIYNEYDNESYLQYVDIESWAKKYLIEEMTGNLDSNYTSQFFYKKNDSKSQLIYAGPVWDYDFAIGNSVYDAIANNTMYSNPFKKIAETEGEIWHMLLKKKSFRSEVIKQYKEFVRPEVINYLNYKIKDISVDNMLSVKMDYVRWKNAVCNTSEGIVKIGEFDNYEKNVEEMRDYLEKRIEFMDKELCT